MPLAETFGSLTTSPRGDRDGLITQFPARDAAPALSVCRKLCMQKKLAKTKAWRDGGDCVGRNATIARDDHRNGHRDADSRKCNPRARMPAMGGTGDANKRLTRQRLREVHHAPCVKALEGRDSALRCPKRLASLTIRTRACSLHHADRTPQRGVPPHPAVCAGSINR